jgi:hypothetical protein
VLSSEAWAANAAATPGFWVHRSAHRWSRPKVIFPDGFDPDNLRMRTFTKALSKRHRAWLGAGKGPTPETALLPGVGTQEKEKKSEKEPQITLYLPSFKTAHLRLYEALVRERRLVADASYERGRPAQADKWDSAMDPNSSRGMSQKVYEAGLRMGLTRERVLRPDWSRDVRYLPMQVDHMVELQLTPNTEREIWNEFDVNYELLGALSNALSGGEFQRNILEERIRLSTETKDPTWMFRPLRFTRVVPAAGPLGQRWLKEEIGRGDHIKALRRLQGER